MLHPKPSVIATARAQKDGVCSRIFGLRYRALAFQMIIQEP